MKPGEVIYFEAGACFEIPFETCGNANAFRARKYNEAFPKFEPLYVSKTGRIEGLWIMGNNYRTSGYYGAYPHGYLSRIMSMFPDVQEADIIHVCAGSLPKGEYTRVDKNKTLEPEICCDAEVFSNHIQKKYKLALVDVPYSEEDALHYGYPMLSRRKTLDQCHKALEVGGWVIWLDQAPPIWAKKNWNWSLAIGMIKSTNHRVRVVLGFQKK